MEHNKPSEMIANVDEDEKLKIKINHGDNIARVLQANTEYWFLTEDGLYEVLMQSRKPIAKQFKKQVKKVVNLRVIYRNFFL
ncbi:BRO family protein [Romboutsia ilealis]|uniref:BRO family protein n=1 Tax=Romboutsia ilealis TaxID=1115758 RepID=UPI003AB92C8C